MYATTIFSISISLLVTWVYGLGVPFLIRFKLHSASYNKSYALVYIVFFLLLNTICDRILADIADPSQKYRTQPFVWIWIAYLSFCIFIADHTKLDSYLQKWKKAMIALLVLAILSSIYAVFSSRNWGSIYSGHTDTAALERYMDVPLKANKEEVHYILGEPDFVGELVEKIPSDGKFEERIKSITELTTSGIDFKGYNTWIYRKASSDAFISIIFHPGNKKLNMVLCYPSDNLRILQNSCEVNGVGLLQTEDEVKNKLGPPNKEEIINGRKRLFYFNYNVAFELYKQKVTKIQVSAPG